MKIIKNRDAVNAVMQGSINKGRSHLNMQENIHADETVPGTAKLPSSVASLILSRLLCDGIGISRTAHRQARLGVLRAIDAQLKIEITARTQLVIGVVAGDWHG